MIKEKQIEEMAKNRPYACGGSCENCSKCDEWRFAKRLYNAGYRKRSEWISVEDMLPKDGETVLTIDSDGEMQVCFYETDWEGIFQQCHGLVMIYNITHWMPLPDPPSLNEVQTRLDKTEFSE